MITESARLSVVKDGMELKHVKTTKFAVVTFANPGPAKVMMIARSLFAAKTLISVLHLKRDSQK
jgi:hypothetical protein